MADEPLVLGIETSCDETGVGLVRGHTLLANTIASSVEEHARYGGVVPEVASRAHLEAMTPTVERALAHAGLLVLLAGVVIGLSQLGVEPWLSAVIVALVTLIIGYLLANRGLAHLRRTNVTPTQTIESLKENTTWTNRTPA